MGLCVFYFSDVSLLAMACGGGIAVEGFRGSVLGVGV